MIRRPPRSTLSSSSAASDVYKRQMVIDKVRILMFLNVIHVLDELEITASRTHIPTALTPVVDVENGCEEASDNPRAVRFTIGVQQSVPAHRASTLLCLEQAQGGTVQQGWALATPLVPVLGQVGVVRGRRAWHQLVPYDLRPGEFRQVGAACAVTEHPPITPGGVEPTEVPVGDPGLRLVLVAVFRPLVRELPQVVIQGAEDLTEPFRVTNPDSV